MECWLFIYPSCCPVQRRITEPIQAKMADGALLGMPSMDGMVPVWERRHFLSPPIDWLFDSGGIQKHVNAMVNHLFHATVNHP